MKARKLYIALTREPKLFGLSYQFVIFLAFIVSLSFLATLSLVALLTAPIIYVVLRLLNEKDEDFIFILLKKFQNTPPVRNKAFWNHTNSYEVNLNKKDER